MNFSNIDSKIEQLNLEWREYDFGDILYAKIPTTLLLENTTVDTNCDTQRYNIRLQSDGNTLIFQEIERVSFVKKAVAMILEINNTLSKQNKVIQSKSKSPENTSYQTH